MNAITRGIIGLDMINHRFGISLNRNNELNVYL